MVLPSYMHRSPKVTEALRCYKRHSAGQQHLTYTLRRFAVVLTQVGCSLEGRA